MECAVESGAGMDVQRTVGWVGAPAVGKYAVVDAEAVVAPAPAAAAPAAAAVGEQKGVVVVVGVEVEQRAADS